MRAIDTVWLLATAAAALNTSPIAHAEDSAASNAGERGFGFTAAFFQMGFFGENQVTPGAPALGGPGISELHYQDAFGTGRGFEAGVYYSFNRFVRVGGNLIQETAPGRHAAGGEFPYGITFGDFQLRGLTVGGQGRYPLGRFAPYILLEIGEARISALSADTGSGTFPYWEPTNVPFLEIGIGSDFRITPKVALTFDARVQDTGDTGHPTPAAGLVSRATGTAATMFCIGVAIDLH